MLPSADNIASAPLEVFHALPGRLAVRDAQDLMAYPFFSLAKTKRIAPIDFHAGNVVVRVEGTHEHGIATIWDADVLIWAASQLVEARDAGIRTSRLMAATPYEILTFARRGTAADDYRRLRHALDRLQSTTIATTIRQPNERRMHRFSWINEWKDRATPEGRPRGLELILPDWFYSGVIDRSLILTIDTAYFDLTGGIERWLYRLVRKHAGRQPNGWRFDFRHLHAKSGSLARFSDFAFDLRQLTRKQSMPGYELSIERSSRGLETLHFRPRARREVGVLIRRLTAQLQLRGQPVNRHGVSGVTRQSRSGVLGASNADRLGVPGARLSIDQERLSDANATNASPWNTLTPTNNPNPLTPPRRRS